MAKKKPAKNRHHQSPETSEPKPARDKSDLRSLSELVVLTGVRAGSLTQAVREGYIGATVKGQYRLGPALLGLIKFQYAHEGHLPTYDNPAQCSEMTGIPLGAIKAARRSGKVGQDGRISLAMLLKVLFEKDSENWIDIRNKFSALREKNAYALQSGEALLKSDVAESIQRASSVLFRLMDQRSNVDLPPMLDGLDALQRQQELVKSDVKLKQAWSNELAVLARNGEAKNGP